MKSRTLSLLIVAGLLGAGSWTALAQPAAKGNAEQEAAILKRAEAFVEAFQKGDAKALAAFWSPDGDYTDELGRNLKGRDAIERAFADLFAENQGLKLRIDVTSLRFITPDVAIEDGTTAVLHPDNAPPSRARYTTVHVRRDGQWSLESVREAPFAPPSNYDSLRSLEWLVGDWAGAADDGHVARISFAWTDNQNFINASFATTFKNMEVTSGTQWIGWDAAAKQIRSWTFDSDGGFAEGTWTRAGDKLTIRTKAVLRDGLKLEATNIVTRIDANTLSFQSKERTLDGKPQPDIQETRLKRTPDKGA